MSIASRIQEIETHIGDVYNTIDYSYDTTGVNKNIINIPKYLKKGYIDIINNGIDTLYNNFPKVSGIGSNLSLTPTYEAPIKLNEIQGDTLQDSQPTPDTPVEIQSVTGLQNVVISNSDSSSSNTYEVNLGKNIWSVGNKNVGWATNYVDVKNILNTLSEGTYSIKLNFKVTEIVKERTDNQYGFAFYNSNGSIGNKKNTNSNINVDDIFTCVYTFTISKSQVGNFTQAYFYGFGNGTDNVTARSLMYDCQLEKGTQATSYSPYFTPIELNKISTYEDRIYKDNGKWYVEKQIGKVVLDNTLSSVGTTNFSNVYQISANVMNISYLIGGYCDNFKFNDDSRITDNNNANSWLSDNQCALRLGNDSARDRFYIKSTNFATANDLKAYFNNNPTTLYYVLSTPTTTEITNTELIEDLETLYTAKSQEGTTNISITSEDLEMILNVSALKSE